MSGNPLCDRRIVESWGKNAEPWTRAVREKQIDSRRQVTDQAIVEAVLSRSPKSLLDIGCGEGWLAGRILGRIQLRLHRSCSLVFPNIGKLDPAIHGKQLSHARLT